MKIIFHITAIIALIFGIFNIAYTSDWNSIIIWNNSKLNFNIHSLTNNNINIKNPTLFINWWQREINWYFWINEIGPVKMQNIKVICLTSTNCSLRWVWTNKTIGEINFWKWNFNPKTKNFYWKIETNIWSFELKDIKLDIDFEIKEKNIHANDKATIKLDTNFGDKIIELTVDNIKRYTWVWDSIKNVDLKKVWNYKLKIKADWKIKYFDIKVIPSDIKSISMEKTGSDIASWNWMKIIFKPKDKYWNSITNWTLGVKFNSNVDNIDTEIRKNLNNFFQTSKKISNSSNIVYSIPQAINTKTNIPIKPNWEAIITIKTSSPTSNTWKIKLSKLEYNGNQSNYEWKKFINLIEEKDKNIEFKNPIDVIINDSEEMYPDHNYEMGITLNKKTNSITNEQVILQYKINDRNSTLNSSYKRLLSNQKYQTVNSSNWFLKVIFNKNEKTKNIESILNTQNSTKDEIEVEIKVYTSYMSIGSQKQQKLTITPVTTITKKIYKNIVDPVKLSIEQQQNQRNRLWNNIRKNISYLNRNTTNFDNKNYIIQKEDIIVDKIDKQTYVSMGGDIILNQNISNKNETPLAFIAMNQDWKWWKILIWENVTNLEWVVLIADKIENYNDKNKDKQLYIFGSVFSENACMDIKNKDCLPDLRSWYNGKDNKKSANWEFAKKYKYSTVIIKYNPWLYSNPPIWLSETIN